jgi:hypothetical protein
MNQPLSMITYRSHTEHSSQRTDQRITGRISGRITRHLIAATVVSSALLGFAVHAQAKNPGDAPARTSKGVSSPRPADPQANSKRCEVHKVDEDRALCEQRMSQGDQSGSVQGGGILRSHSITVQPATTGSPQPQAVPAAPAMPAQPGVTPAPQ